MSGDQFLHNLQFVELHNSTTSQAPTIIFNGTRWVERATPHHRLSHQTVLIHQESPAHPLERWGEARKCITPPFKGHRLPGDPAIKSLTWSAGPKFVRTENITSYLVSATRLQFDNSVQIYSFRAYRCVLDRNRTFGWRPTCFMRCQIVSSVV